MFAARRMAKAKDSCIEALQQFTTRPAFLGPWPNHFWRDPFVMGFIVGVVGLVTEWSAKGKLNTEQRGQVLIDTLRGIGTDSTKFTDRVADLPLREKVDYQQGLLSAQKVVTYVLNLAPMPNDPDVARATELARGSSLSVVVGRDEIGGALMQLVFHQVVRERLQV